MHTTGNNLKVYLRGYKVPFGEEYQIVKKGR